MMIPNLDLSIQLLLKAEASYEMKKPKKIKNYYYSSSSLGHGHSRKEYKVGSMLFETSLLLFIF
jgi:hypothetical protein